MTPSPSDSLAFEKALADLERILRDMEDGTASLETSLAEYERGIGLLKECYRMLRDAEQRILRLSGLDGEGKPVLETFEHSATLDATVDARKANPRPKTKGEESSY